MNLIVVQVADTDNITRAKLLIPFKKLLVSMALAVACFKTSQYRAFISFVMPMQ